MFLTYNLAIWGLWFILTMLFIQSMIATIAHRKQSHYVPGRVDDNLGHDSFVFRSHRTHQNSLENLPLLVFPALLAIMVGFSPTALAVIIWIYAIARLLHMVLYYAIATEKNPSPRSYFYIIGWLDCGVLLVMLAIHLL
ncbi:MAPEG family protein [Alteromonas ponticola]|uniref:MAPEG family protein n=1 Tax=Alteromonas aquimaris TaxID=2998417 RepID=A0ABT3PAX7_9ALTE|nr:MAPEG family protein [Alteromonas aquimaris]MCW8109695.1 MAPEG family protein [Alteromonas aquimaris]